MFKFSLKLYDLFFIIGIEEFKKRTLRIRNNTTGVKILLE